MRLVVATMIAILASAGLVADAAEKSPAKPAATAGDVETTAARYRELRALRGHFDGGTWRAELDRWQGDKHRVMVRLGESLGREGVKAKEVRRLMGKPDRIARDDLPGWEETRAQLPELKTRELWIYHWRGEHDYLAFAVDGAKVAAAQWYLAGE